MKALALIALVSLLLTSPGCRLIVDFEPFSFHTANLELPRIVLGKSIDGLKPGDSTQHVEALLGPPTTIGYGDFAGFLYGYGQGSRTAEATELELLFAEEYEDRLLRMTVHAPYPGTTKEGIGIGSSKQEVRRVFGAPAWEQVQPRWRSLGRPWIRGDGYVGRDSVAMVFGYDGGGVVARIELFRMSF